MVALVTGTRRGARRGTGSSGCVSRFGRRRCIWRSRGGAFGTGGRSAATSFEIGGVPTRPLELKTCSCELLGVRRLAARGTVTQGWVRHFLQLVFSEAASAAFISINWHR
jgi:hypothetical protein